MRIVRNDFIYSNILATKDFLLSDEYEETIRYKDNRKQKTYHLIGAWRWDCIFKHRFLLIPYIFDENLKGVDFGGFMGPIGGFSEIVDKANNTTLDSYEDGSLDYIFSSHCIEHLPGNLMVVLVQIYDKLKKGGKIFFLLPSWQKRIWRAGVEGNSHNYTFKLKETDCSLGENIVIIDSVLRNIGFDLKIAEYCYKCCIFIYGEKI